MTQSIEKKVAATVLQQPEEVVVGENTYYVSPPSVATLILVSEAVSRLPRRVLDSEKVMGEVLANAQDCRPLGEIAAILILGAKGIEKVVSEVETQRKKYLWGIVRRNVKKAVSRKINCKDALAEEILENFTPQQLNNLIARLLKRMQIADFFGLTTFLTEVNLLRQTKVEEES